MSDSSERLLREAQGLAGRGRLEEAIALLEQLLRSDPRHRAALTRLGDLCRRSGDTDKAALYLERLAELAVEGGDLARATGILKQVSRLAPERLDVRCRVADLCLAEGDREGATRELNRVVRAASRRREYAQAVDAARKLVQLDPADHAAALRLADLLLRSGETDKGFAACNSLGWTFLARGQLDLALEACRLVLDRRPPACEPLAPLCRALLDAGQTETALELLDLGLAWSPGNAELAALAASARTVM